MTIAPPPPAAFVDRAGDDPQAENKVKSCLTCPNRLNEQETAVYFKKATGTATCAKYGHILSTPKAPNSSTELGKFYGTKCPSYGSTRAAVSSEVNMKVFLPDPKFMSDNENDPKVVSCTMCEKYIRPEAVMAETGINAGVCSGTGRLILASRMGYEAASCGISKLGANQDTVAGVMLRPEYEESFKVSKQNVSIPVVGGTYVSPTVHPTDKPLTEQDTARGILSWKKILDPDGSNRFTYLPIYAPGFFSESQLVTIPQAGDDEHPEWYADHQGLLYKVAVLWMELDETPALWGTAGSGKTEFFRHMAWQMQAPFRRISVTGSTEVEDLAGKMLYSKERGTYFQYGRLSSAWNQPGVLCLDEPNVGPPDVWQFIRPLTDNSKQLVLDMNEGERLARHSDAFLGMAMNPAWDTRNVGAGVIGDADGSRLMHIFMELPPVKIEQDIIRQRCLGDGFEITGAQLKMIMGIAREIRELCKDGTLSITWGVRPQIKVARALRWFDAITAYRLGSADYLEPEAQEILLGVVRAHVS